MSFKPNNSPLLGFGEEIPRGLRVQILSSDWWCTGLSKEPKDDKNSEENWQWVMRACDGLQMKRPRKPVDDKEMLEVKRIIRQQCETLKELERHLDDVSDDSEQEDIVFKPLEE